MNIMIVEDDYVLAGPPVHCRGGGKSMRRFRY